MMMSEPLRLTVFKVTTSGSTSRVNKSVTNPAAFSPSARSPQPNRSKAASSTPKPTAKQH